MSWVVLGEACPLTDCRILYSTYFEFIVGKGPSSATTSSMGFMMVLHVLHILLYLILRMLYRFTWKGKVGGAKARDTNVQHHQIGGTW